MVEAAGFHDHHEGEISSAESRWERPGDDLLARCVENYQTLTDSEPERAQRGTRVT